MIKQILFLMMATLMVSGCFGNKVIVDSNRDASMHTGSQPQAKKIVPAHSTKACCHLTGNYTYSGGGTARLDQSGSTVHMYLTWPPKGKGPHYEIKGILIGNTIKGKLYSHYDKQGWFDFTGTVSPSGKMIDISETIGPMKSNLNKIVLLNNSLLRGTGIGFIPTGEVNNYMRTQESRLRSRLSGTGIDILRDKNYIILKLPNNITFDSDSDVLKSKFTPTLKTIANVLKEFKSTLITAIGHTDNVGAAEYNQTLSEKRAKSLTNYLSSNGISVNRLTSIGKGQFQPISSNNTSSGRALNRRVEIMLEPLYR